MALFSSGLQPGTDRIASENVDMDRATCFLDDAVRVFQVEVTINHRHSSDWRGRLQSGEAVGITKPTP